MSLSYTIRESLAGFKRNISATLITIFTVSISLLLLGVFAIISLNVSAVVADVRGRVDLEVFLKDGLTDAQLGIVRRALMNIRGVKETKYVSKEEAARRFKEEIGEDFSEILDENPLPASYTVVLYDEYLQPDSARAIVDRIEKFIAVDPPVAYRKQFLSLLDRRARTLRTMSLLVGIALALSAIVLVANTIRLTISAKRELIRTMKLVGATAMFIRLPFLFEGVWHGLIGGIVASVLIGVTFGYFISPFLQDLPLGFDVGAGFYLLLTVTGCLLGFVGSVVSIGRFLREALVAAQ